MKADLTCVIVEDERAAQEYLQTIIEQHFSQLTVCAVAESVPEAVAAITLHEPSIVFLDVEIKMGTGFDVLLELRQMKSEVIFTTAFNNYAIDAFQHNAVDYLLKPLDAQRTIKEISKSMERIALQTAGQQVQELLNYIRKPLPRLAISTLSGIEFIETDQILFAEAQGNYTRLKLKSGPDVIVTRKIREIGEQLAESAFCRIHASYIVSIINIKRYSKGRGGYVTMADGTALPVASSRKDDFFKAIGYGNL